MGQVVESMELDEKIEILFHLPVGEFVFMIVVCVFVFMCRECICINE